MLAQEVEVMALAIKRRQIGGQAIDEMFELGTFRFFDVFDVIFEAADIQGSQAADKTAINEITFGLAEVDSGMISDQGHNALEIAITELEVSVNLSASVLLRLVHYFLKYAQGLLWLEA